MANLLLPEVTRCIEYLKEAYIREPPKNTVSSWIMIQQHQQLALITSEKEVSYAAMDSFTRSTLHGNDEDIMKPKKTLLLSQVGTSEDSTPPRLTLIEGRHAVGKSRLARHLALLWRERKLFTDHTLFLLLNLQDARLHTATTVEDLIQHPDPVTSQTTARWMVEECGRGCLILLDGYSDLPSEIQSNSIYADIVCCRALKGATVLVTSRPVLSEVLQQGTSAECQHVEVVGFSDADIFGCCSSFFNQGEGAMMSDFESYLESVPVVHSVMHIPLYCVAVVKVYLQLLGGVTLPHTLTHLHHHFVFLCIVESLGIPLQAGQREISCLPRHVQELLNQISKMAYEGLLEDKYVYHDVGDGLLTLGLMEVVPTRCPTAHPAHRFLHKYLQHYLAARHVMQITPAHRQFDMITEISNKPHMHAVLRYIAGMTTPSSGLSTPRVKFFLLSIFEDRHELLHFLYSVCNVSKDFMECMHFTFEAQQPRELMKLVTNAKSNYIQPRPLSLADCYTVGYCTVGTGLEWSELDFRNCRIDVRGVGMMAHMRDSSKRSCFALVTSLDMSHNPIGDPGLDYIVSAMKGEHSLQELKLADCLITSMGAERLAGVVTTARTLSSLDLSCNTIGNRGANHLATALRVNSTLSHLLLCGCGIGEEGASALAGALMSDTARLKKLDVTNNNIGQSSQLIRVTRCLVQMGDPTA